MSGKPQPPEVITGRPTLHGAYQRPTRSRRVRRARRRLVALLTEDFLPSTREQMLISTTADAMIRLNEANAYIDQQGGIVDAKGQPLGVTKVYVALINTIRRNLEALGLRPDKTEKVLTPTEYYEQKRNGANGNGHSSAATVPTHTEGTVDESDDHSADSGAADSHDTEGAT